MIKDTIRKDLTSAMKHQEALKVSTLRLMLTEIVRKEKEKGKLIDDDTAVKVLYSMIKRGEDAAQQFSDAGREDAAGKEREEIKIIKSYLPPQLSEGEIREEVRQVIAEVGAQSVRDMGKVMGILSGRLAGKASGSEMSKVAREMLEALR